MNLRNAVISGTAAVVVGVGGGVAVAKVGRHTEQPSSQSPPASTRSAEPSPTPSAGTPAPSPSTAATTADTKAPAPTPTPKRLDEISEENLVRERLYYDVTGHSFSHVSGIDRQEPLGPCTGDTTFDDVLPSRGLKTIGTILAGNDVTRVTEVLAQAQTPAAAKAAAASIVSAVEECPAIQGGDFGYGAPVTEAQEGRQVSYFPGYDSDRRYGGYIVFAVGNRVGVISVADTVGPEKMSSLAREAAGIAGI